MRSSKRGSSHSAHSQAMALALPQAMGTSPAVGQQELDFEQIAIDYVRDHAAELGLDDDDVAQIRVSASYTSKHNRVTHVYLRQQRDGIDVANANMTVNIDRLGNVLFIGNRFVSLPPPTGTATLTAVEAAEAAADELGIKGDANLRVLERSGGVSRATELSRGGISARKIPAKLVYELVDGKLVLAWKWRSRRRRSDHWWSANVNAETGELLSKVDYVDHDNAGNVALSLASNAGLSASASAALAPATGKGTGVGDGSSYNVYEIPKGEPAGRGRGPSLTSGSFHRFALRLARHRWRGGSRVHGDAREQRARLHGSRQRRDSRPG